MDLQTVKQRWTVANEESLMSYDDRYFAFSYFSSTCWFFGQTISEGLGRLTITGVGSKWRHGKNPV